MIDDNSQLTVTLEDGAVLMLDFALKTTSVELKFDGRCFFHFWHSIKF